MTNRKNFKSTYYVGDDLFIFEFEKDSNSMNFDQMIKSKNSKLRSFKSITTVYLIF